jgi:selenocysteine lyase/cysteine desulfurase
MAEVRHSLRQTVTEEEVLSWRDEFPILSRKIHVANCSQSAQAKRVRRAVNAYLDNWQDIGMDWDLWMAEVVRAKQEFAGLIGAEDSEISVSMSVSDAVAGVAGSLDYPAYPGKRNGVVVTLAEFPTVGQIWLAHERYGAQVSFVPLNNGAVELEEYDRLVTDRTLLTSITHVYYQNGFKQDLDAIVDLCHRKGSMVLVDGYQSCGTCAVDVHKQNIDMYTSGNLKYLLGLPGIAFLYVNKEIAPRLKPVQTGWFGQRDPFSFQVNVLDYSGDTRRFDTGTPPVITAFAARAGMAIINEIGPARIGAYLDDLSSFTIAEADKRSIPVVSPRDIRRKGPITAIPLKMDSHVMEKELAKRDIVASARGSVIRIAPHFYTTRDDIIRVLDCIRDIIDTHEGKNNQTGGLL